MMRSRLPVETIWHRARFTDRRDRGIKPAMRDPEYQYLDLVEAVLARGDRRIDRTGVGTSALFGALLRFDLSEGRAPILTTKRVFWKTAVKEMLWFLTGGTN